MIIFTVLIAIFPLGIMGAVLANVINKQVIRLSIENYTYVNEKAMSNYQLILKSFEDLSVNYIVNSYIQKSLEKGKLLPQDEMYVNRGLWYTNNPYAEYCIYLDNKGNEYDGSRVYRNVGPQDILPKEILELLKEDYAIPKLVYGTIQKNQISEKGIFMVRNIHHMERSVDHGILIIKANEQFYKDIFADIQKDENISCWMLGAQGELCFSQNGLELDQEVQKKILDILEQNSEEVKYVYYGDHIYFVSRDQEKGFLFVSSVPLGVIRGAARMFLQIVLLVMAGMVVVSIGIAYFVTRPYIADIHKLSKIMSSFDGESLKQQVELNSNTELDQMAAAYNHMLGHIETLLEQVKREQEELRENEYNSLAYQINPHFLYNTLDNIHMMARISKNQKMEDLIQALSKMLRISLSKGENKVSLKEELDHVTAYLEIEKIRNAELFTYEIFMQESLNKKKIPKIILQPIVENCIKYGFADLDEGGKIKIEALEEGGCIHIRIENNGTPIEEETEEILNQMQYQSMEKIKQIFPQKSGGYGISNVVCRLCLCYGEAFRICYEHTEEGTCCHLKLPLEE